MLTKKILANLKEKLQNQKSAIIKELETFAEKDPNLKHNWNTKFPNKEKGNPEEEADDATEFDQMISLEHSLEIKLKDVDMALEKMHKEKTGKYGVCEKCEKKIEEKRLDACPEARLCIKCNI